MYNNSFRFKLQRQQGGATGSTRSFPHENTLWRQTYWFNTNTDTSVFSRSTRLLLVLQRLRRISFPCLGFSPWILPPSRFLHTREPSQTCFWWLQQFEDSKVFVDHPEVAWFFSHVYPGLSSDGETPQRSSHAYDYQWSPTLVLTWAPDWGGLSDFSSAVIPHLLPHQVLEEISLCSTFKRVLLSFPWGARTYIIWNSVWERYLPHSANVSNHFPITAWTHVSVFHVITQYYAIYCSIFSFPSLATGATLKWSVPLTRATQSVQSVSLFCGVTRIHLLGHQNYNRWVSDVIF